MTGERCGELCAVTLANNLSETWMAKFPVIPMCYFYTYFPVLRNMLVLIANLI